MTKLGAHISGAASLSKIPEKAHEIGSECIQIFGASPRQWFAKMPEKSEVEKFKENCKKLKIGPVYLHAAYLVNLASSNKDLREKSIKNLTDHLKIAEILNATGLIFHLGSGKDIERDLAINFTAQGMKKVLEGSPGESYLIMENSAGGGNKLGGNISEIGHIFGLVKSKRVKVCLDTAHAYEAGIINGYSKENIKKLMDEFENEIGLDNLIVIHANDSKTAFNSKNDRHENIGEGLIGIEGFKNLANEKRLKNKDWILEVPGFDDLGPDKKNLDILKRCF